MACICVFRLVPAQLPNWAALYTFLLGLLLRTSSLLLLPHLPLFLSLLLPFTDSHVFIFHTVHKANSACMKATNISCEDRRETPHRMRYLTKDFVSRGRAAVHQLVDRSLFTTEIMKPSHASSTQLKIGTSPLGSQYCGNDPARVCSISVNDEANLPHTSISCLATDNASNASSFRCKPGSTHMCRPPTYRSDLCFGVAVQQDRTRSRTITNASPTDNLEDERLMECCHKACGDGTLHSATCYMNTHTM